MRIKYKHRKSNAENLLYVLLIIKPLVEMFSTISFLKYFIMLGMIVVLLLGLIEGKWIHFCGMDWLIISWAALFTFSLCKSFDDVSVNSYIKFISAVLMYFIGRIIINVNSNEIHDFLRHGYIITLFFDLLSIPLSIGYITWGSSNTFKGFYYFKTDLGVALLFLIILCLLKTPKKAIDWILITVSIIMLVLTNSRISYLSLAIVFVYYIMFLRERKNNRQLKIRIKLIIEVAIALLVMLYLIRFLGSSELFTSNKFISFRFDKLSDLFSASNTQGRSVIWAKLLNEFNNAPIIDKLTGIRLNNDIVLSSTYGEVGSHSLYIGLLYSTGYIGIAILTLFVFFLLQHLNHIQNRQLFYVTLFSVSVFLLFGISVDTYNYIGYTWNVFLLIGICVFSSKQQKKSKSCLKKTF